jgi:hypothetical protein
VSVSVRPLSDSESRLLTAARLVAVEHGPYLAHALFASQPVAAEGLGTLAVDRGWRPYVDPLALRLYVDPLASCARSSANPTSCTWRASPAISRGASMRNTASMLRCVSSCAVVTYGCVGSRGSFWYMM